VRKIGKLLESLVCSKHETRPSWGYAHQLSNWKTHSGWASGGVITLPFQGINRQVSQGTIDGCSASLSRVGVVVWYLGRPRHRIIVASRKTAFSYIYVFPTPSGSNPGLHIRWPTVVRRLLGFPPLAPVCRGRHN
jgi:hypothetical protein